MLQVLDSSFNFPRPRIEQNRIVALSKELPLTDGGEWAKETKEEDRSQQVLFLLLSHTAALRDLIMLA